NGMAGFWVSFKIDDDDEYWLMLESRRLGGAEGWQWLGGAGVVLLLSLLGGLIISRLINLPLARISAAAKAIAEGEEPKPLPETGSSEINETNRSFNQMVADLKRIESDRALILAGISHDLRTPLARMQLEIEMADLSPEARDGMQSDIAQMDAIIGQFLDFAKPTETTNFTQINFSDLIAEAAQDAGRLPDVRITTKLEPDVMIDGHSVDIRRVVNNLIENARRYGRTPGTELLELDFIVHHDTIDGQKRAVLEFSDHGKGVPEDQIKQLRKPFTRLDTARGQANGAGLGLAIVDRVIMRHGGHLMLDNRSDGGFLIRIDLPVARNKAHP
ncbi:MAG: HAMP domain-containing protein, partial [Burkholderiales bacterium]|nr:HAMP domain-containing protein [Burkholderiales bacterium]